MSNKSRVFEFLYRNSGSRYNINQISRLTGISVGSAFKILKNLEKDNYANAEKRNNSLLYQINQNGQTKDAFEDIEEEKRSKNLKKTKIICTLGKSSESGPLIGKLIEKGMDAAKIDSSFYDEKGSAGIIKKIREISDQIPIILDISKNSEIKPWARAAMENDIDFIIVSIKNADDIRRINRLLGYSDMKQVIGEKIKVLARLVAENLGNHREIIEEAYGVVVDRDSLVKGKRYEMLPLMQKMIIEECNKQGKPAIISGQVLKSMAGKNFPEATEVYSITNMVLDGASCIMLSGETGAGNYPEESVAALSRIIKGVESGLSENYIGAIQEDFVHSIGKAVLEVEKNANIDAILILTSGGYSARMISGRRLKCKVIAATSSRKISRQLNILWGISPLLIKGNLEDISSREKKEAVTNSLKKGFIKKSDRIAIVASVFHSKSKITNLLEIHKVNEFLDYLDGKSNGRLITEVR
ncbi:hypothetical protein HYX08_07030 [Candidatus Woesearchaeota archaeon]|nr:hypothetical protein [Candidatus Woesearchaeota archaeon]